MAEHGASEDERSLEGVVGDLRTMHQEGAYHWEGTGGATSLDYLAKLSQVKAAIGAGQSPGEAIWQTVKAACQALFFHERFQNAALAYFGYPYQRFDNDLSEYIEEMPGRSPFARRQGAAKCLSVSYKRFLATVTRHPRVYDGRHYSSYVELIEDAVARALLSLNDDSPADGEGHRETVVDIETCYRQTPRAELQKHGFFERDSTLGYIDDLAALATDQTVPITIYAGAGVSADIGAEPLRRQFMERLLREMIAKADFLQEASKDEGREFVEGISAAIARTYETPYLGSIVRELAHQGRRSPDVWATDEDNLRHAIGDVLAAGIVPGQFVARAIAACAFAMRHALAEVDVVTSHYDEVLTRAAEHVRTPLYLPEALTNYRFIVQKPPQAGETPVPPRNTEVSVTHLNGSMANRSAPHLVIGEGDFFAEYGANMQLEREHSEWRHRVLSDKLGHTTCVFVGSTLTDPDVLEHLARTKYLHRRFALLLQPTFDEHKEKERAPGTHMHYAGRELVARRFLHLGVIPIIAEHSHQIPQFLREVALKVMQGETYQPYSTRARFWWGYWAKAFGHQRPDSPGGRRSESLQEHWQAGALAEAMKCLEEQFATDKSSKIRDEAIVLELWVRNQYQRSLELWARSDARLLDTSTAYSGSLRGDDHRYISVKAFQEGRALKEIIAPKKEKRDDLHWRYCWSIPLVLYEAPWYHLPVGVLNVISNKDENETSSADGVNRIARLMNTVNPAQNNAETVEELEEALKGIVLRELDPKSATWKSSERTDWSSYVGDAQAANQADGV